MPIETPESKAADFNSAAGASLSEQFWQGMKVGGKDELRYELEHPVDTTVRASLAAGVGYLAGGEYTHNRAALGWSTFGGAVITTAHFFGPDHIDDMASSKVPIDFQSGVGAVGYVAGRFATDATLMIGTSALVNRVTWHNKGNAEIERIVDKDREVLYFKGHKGSRGRYYSGHSEDTPIFRQERGEDLAFLLKERGQLNRLPGVLDRLSGMGEPENVVNWSTGVRTRKNYDGIPEFNPKEIIAKAMKTK